MLDHILSWRVAATFARTSNFLVLDEYHSISHYNSKDNFLVTIVLAVSCCARLYLLFLPSCAGLLFALRSFGSAAPHFRCSDSRCCV
ncbi:hypothetical protein VNO78_01297 [Psophocarpus tetragonolobus]|uniref:Uncharacterized protein n=1 Tax=Psophocarpus tetragonolobus TaxID=3891 RepID=A0AAN9T978_PSOTE